MRNFIFLKYFYSKRALCLLLLSVFSFITAVKVSAYTITKFPTQNLCATGFSTAYVPGSFAITESTVGEFPLTPGSGKTLQFDVPAGWRYNIAAGVTTVTINGTDATISNISTTTSRISFKVSVDFILEINTITVNCEVRADAAGAPLFIRRNGGTLKVAGSTKKPTASESLGDLYAQQAMTFTSCTAAQTNTATVSTNTIDNDIIQIQVVVLGTCNTFSVTQLDFNTTGSTNPAGDITTAKVYYTGTTGTYSPSGLFGTFASPNGAFSITGSQVLSAGTNYFWLAYDVPTSATVNNLLDATCSSVVMSDGVGAKTPTTQAPAGSRKIYVLIDYYSIATGIWNDNNNWSLTDGGASCGCQPNGSGNVFINTNHTITLDAARMVDFLTIRNGATLQDNGSSALTVNNNFNTIGSGKIVSTSNVTISGFATFNGTGASTTTADFTIVQAATIGAGVSITANGTAGNDLIIQANLFLDGTLSSGASGATILMNGAAAQSIDASSGSSIAGSGDLVFSTSAKTISSISNFAVTPSINISVTVTNNGTVTVTGSITGTGTWVNAANSVLNIAGASLLSSGTLTSTAAPNTINYNSAGAQTVKNTTYYNLVLSNSGTKTFAGNVPISNDLTLSGSAIGDVGTFILNGAGSLTMSGTTELKIALAGTTEPQLTGAYGLSGGTITLNQSGATTQTVNGNPIYYNLKLDGGNVASLYDATSVTDVFNNFELAGQAKMTLNGIMLIGGSFIHNTTNTTTLTNDLTVRGNWTNNAGTFAANAKIVTLDGLAAAQTIGGTNPTTFYSLVLNNTFATSPQFIFSVNTIVANSFTMTSGISNLSGTTFTLGNGGVATLTRTASTTTNWFYGGTLKRYWPASAITSTSGSYYGLFPLGEATASSYSPLQINSTVNPTGPGNFSATYTPVPTLGFNLNPTYEDGVASGIFIEHIMNGSFATAVSGITGGTYNISATMTGLDPSGSINDVRLAISTGGTTASAVGTHVAATGTPNNPTAGRSGLTIADLTTKDFRIGTTNKGVTPLPVEFLAFNATPNGKVVDLDWSTAVEMNTDYFMVQHSGDAITFEDVAKVKASGNSSSVKNYSLVDTDPYSGVSYYRLKQFDFDGKYSFSNVKAVNVSSAEAISVFPNPASGPFNLSVSGTKGDRIALVIRDVLGREFYSEVIWLSSPSEVIAIDPPGKLASGVYTVISTSDNSSCTKKFVVR